MTTRRRPEPPVPPSVWTPKPVSSRLQQWAAFGAIVTLAFLPLSAAALALNAQMPWSRDGRILPISQHWMDPSLTGGHPSNALNLEHRLEQRLALNGTIRQAELLEGHRALRAFDLPRARTIAGELSKAVADSADGRYYLARLAFYEGDYAKALQLLGSNSWSGPDGRSWSCASPTCGTCSTTPRNSTCCCASTWIPRRAG